MAYQNVGTPRFYVNVLDWLDTIGYMNIFNIHRTLPVAQESWDGSQEDGITAFNSQSFVAILGHTLSGTIVSIVDYVTEGADWLTWKDPIINGTVGTTYSDIEYDGFSILGFDGGEMNAVKLSATPSGQVGSVIFGTYYSMPHSPELNLTMTREYGGIKTIETKGGASLSNTFYTKPPAWGNLGAWELGGGGFDKKLSKSGRRIWDLSFSYLDKGDVWGSNQSLAFDTWQNEIADGTPPASAFDGTPGENGADLAADAETFNYNLLTDDNFYSQVIHKTNGGQLPFIFQPNKDDNTTFAICKFDMKSFKFEQVANGVYNVKLKIREVW